MHINSQTQTTGSSGYLHSGNQNIIQFPRNQTYWLEPWIHTNENADPHTISQGNKIQNLSVFLWFILYIYALYMSYQSGAAFSWFTQLCAWFCTKLICFQSHTHTPFPHTSKTSMAMALSIVHQSNLHTRGIKWSLQMLLQRITTTYYVCKGNKSKTGQS